MTTETIRGADQLAVYLKRVSAELMPAMDRLTSAVAEVGNTVARASINARQGPRAFVGGHSSQPGTLENSLITIGPDLGANTVRYSVASDVVYARIQELGGTITANGNSGGDGVYLKFRSYFTGQWVQVDSVTLPAKHYLKKGAEFAASQVQDIAAPILRELLA